MANDPTRPLDPIEDRWRESDPAEVPNGPTRDDDETDRLHQYVEDLLSGPEPYEGNPYDGTDSSDPDFYSDRGDDYFNDWGGEA